MKYYHLHVYFEPNDLESARLWSTRADLLALVDSVKFREYPVGPHPTGMIEAYFNEMTYPAVIAWVKENRGDFSAMIHQDTGDDFKDHTDHIQWIGKELPLNFEFFKLIQTSPELRIHQPKTLV